MTPPAALFYISIVILVWCATGIEAWPSGFGHCDPKVPTSFKSLHGSNGSGGLESGDITLSSTTDGTSTETSNLDEVTTTLDVGTVYTLTIESAGGEPYKGFLVRISDKSGADVSGGLVRTRTNDAKFLSFCESNAVGITHTNYDLKSGVSMTLRSEVPVQLLLEVTVVTENNMHVKDAYYYSEYELTIGFPTSIAKHPKRKTPRPTSTSTSAPAKSSGSFFVTVIVLSCTLSFLSFSLML